MIDVFERIRYVKEIIQAIYPKMSKTEIKHRLKLIARTLGGTRGALSEEDKIIFSLLFKRGIKPGTAYSWYRVLGLPEYIQQELREKRISMREAFSKNLDNNRPQEVLAEELRSEIIEYVNKIAQKDFLRGGEYALR